MMRRTIAATTLCLSYPFQYPHLYRRGAQSPTPTPRPSLNPAIIKVDSRGNPKAEIHKGPRPQAGALSVGEVLMKHKIVRSRA
jgi:hypothetical protein